MLQAEIDAAVLHLYKLNRRHAEWLLDSFTVLRKYEEAECDGFRTKETVLGIYDAMAASEQSGTVYRTSVDPPPGSPAAANVPARSVAAAD